MSNNLGTCRKCGGRIVRDRTSQKGKLLHCCRSCGEVCESYTEKKRKPMSKMKYKYELKDMPRLFFLVYGLVVGALSMLIFMGVI